MLIFDQVTFGGLWYVVLGTGFYWEANSIVVKASMDEFVVLHCGFDTVIVVKI